MHMTTSALDPFTPLQPAYPREPDTPAHPAHAQMQPPGAPPDRVDRHFAHRHPQPRGPSLPAADAGAAARDARSNAATSPPRTRTPPTPRDTAPNRARNERYADESELASLLERYDAGNANASGDALNAALGAQLEQAAMVGYPDQARAFEQNVQTDLGMCADLPLDARGSYEDKLKALWTGFEASPDAWDRSRFADAERALHDELASETDAAAGDPDSRLHAVFNVPFGSDMLSVDGRQQLLALADARKLFRLAHTKEDREAAFLLASRTKLQLQDEIAATTRSQIQEQKALWATQKTDVLKELERAASLTGPGATPGSRLAEFGNRVFADARHARAFTELRQREPERFAQLTQWENELASQHRDASRSLPEVPLTPPRNFSDIRFTLPAPGPRYEDALLALYVDALHGIVAAEKRISIAHEPKSSPIRANYIKMHRPVELPG
jgi:hypothetical protein